jgi:hypothetical protein
LESGGTAAYGVFRSMGKRADWSRFLLRPFVIPGVMTLKTLADVRELMRHLPADRRGRQTWCYVAAQLTEAAAGGDPADVAIALRMVLSIEGVECQP